MSKIYIIKAIEIDYEDIEIDYMILGIYTDFDKALQDFNKLKEQSNQNKTAYTDIYLVETETGLNKKYKVIKRCLGFDNVKQRYVIYILNRGYIRTLQFPISNSEFTDIKSQAQQFYDKEWIKEKFKYYGLDNLLKIEKIGVEDEPEGNLIRILREIDEKLYFVRISLHFTDYGEQTWTVPERLTKEIIDRVKDDLSIDEIKLYIRT